jgi:hypothetical protein
MMTATRSLAMGPSTLDFPSEQFGELTDSTGAPVATLRQRLADDGYLLIRGLHDRAEVLRARRDFLTELSEMGKLQPGTPIEEGRARPGAGGGFFGGQEHKLNVVPSFRAVVDGRRPAAFFDTLFGEPSMTYDFKWLRVVAPGEFTSAHMDMPYMGRGTEEVYTVWTPFGDTPAEMGTLALVPKSHRLPGFARVRETYGRMDVDRDHVHGSLEDDPVAVTGKWGGTWHTTDFRAGDVLIFGMHVMHMSTTNQTDRIRLSSDTRHQRAAQLADERWVGEKPIGHYGWNSPDKNVQLAEVRQAWGI